MIDPGGIVWIASFPKSGNTWVRMILGSLLGGGGAPDFAQFGGHCPSGAHFRWLADTLDIDAGDLTGPLLTAARVQAYRAVAREGRRWLKVHDAFDPALFPADVTARSVYVVRDPRDVAPSWADHMNVDLDGAVARLCEAGFTASRAGLRYHDQAPQTFGSWSQNVRSWIDAPARPLLLLRYEDLLADPVEQVTRLARFLGFSDDPPVIQAAVAACRFDVLQARERELGFRERMPHQARFFRQGTAGAWRRTLSDRQAAMIWDAHHETMQALGYSEDGVSVGG